MKTQISNRFQELIKIGEGLYKEMLKPTSSLSDYDISLRINKIHSELVTWDLSSKNILRKIFGESSEHFILFKNTLNRGGPYYENIGLTYSKENVNIGLGIIKSAADEFNLGFTHNITHILSVELFDTVLEQAKELLKKGFKDPAAILGRVIIENTLKDLCNKNKIILNGNEKISDFNELLKNSNILTLPNFKLCRIYIETGNLAAHGDFNKYNNEDIGKMLDYIENTLIVM
ncbi:hypothetical protein J4230_02610 [Candidatus Woesearchaeota archaeon]|nr:hypothetical protein [Candidatus Woesearchaeota archaeon]